MVLGWQLPGAVADLDYSRAMQQLAARSPIFTTRLAASQQALESGIRAVGTAEDRQNAWYNLATLLADRTMPLEWSARCVTRSRGPLIGSSRTGRWHNYSI